MARAVPAAGVGLAGVTTGETWAALLSVTPVLA